MCERILLCAMCGDACFFCTACSNLFGPISIAPIWLDHKLLSLEFLHQSLSLSFHIHLKETKRSSFLCTRCQGRGHSKPLRSLLSTMLLHDIVHQSPGNLHCTWIHQCLLKGLLQLLALGVPPLRQVAVHLITYDHDSAHLLPLLQCKSSLLGPLYRGQFSHLLNTRGDSHAKGPKKHYEKNASIIGTKEKESNEVPTSKHSSSFIPCCHFSNSLSQFRTVLRGQTTSAVLNSSLSHSSNV